MEFIDLNLKNYPNTRNKSIPYGLNSLIRYAILLNYAPNLYDDLELSYDENNQMLKIITKRGSIATRDFIYNDLSYSSYLLRNAISNLSFNNINISFSSSEGNFNVVIKDKLDIQEKISCIFIARQPKETTDHWISLKDLDNNANQPSNQINNGTTITVHPVNILDLKAIKNQFSFLQTYQAVIKTKYDKLLIAKNDELNWIYLNGAKMDAGLEDQALNKTRLIYSYDFDYKYRVNVGKQYEYDHNDEIIVAILASLSEQDQKQYFPAIFNNEKSLEWKYVMVQELITMNMCKFNPEQYLIYCETEPYPQFMQIAKDANKTLVKLSEQAYWYLRKQQVNSLYAWVQTYMRSHYTSSNDEVRWNKETGQHLNYEEYENIKTLDQFINDFVLTYPKLKEAWDKMNLPHLYIAVFSQLPDDKGFFWREAKAGLINRKNLINTADLFIAGKKIAYETAPQLDYEEFSNKWSEALINYFISKEANLRKNNNYHKKINQKKKPS